MAVKQLLKRLAALMPATAYRALRNKYRALRADLSLAQIAVQDWRAFRRGSGLLHANRPKVLEASIIKNYHRVEKGLALKHPRPGFGADAIAALQEEIRWHIDNLGYSSVTRAATNTLQEYVQFNTAHGSMQPNLARDVASLLAAHEKAGFTDSAGGTRQVTRDEIHKVSRHDMAAFFASRYSVRSFDPGTVDMATIAAAVHMAQKTPSVCNRAAGRVIVIEGKNLQAKLLAFQNGNRGFGDQADKILVLGSSQDCFLTIGERHQAWIDGGMFAMSMVYALHSLGLGSCCLNWSVEPSVDQAFKKAAGLPENLAITMLLAVGHLPAQFAVAQSPQRPLDQVLGRVTANGDSAHLTWGLEKS